MNEDNKSDDDSIAAGRIFHQFNPDGAFDGNFMGFTLPNYEEEVVEEIDYLPHVAVYNYWLDLAQPQPHGQIPVANRIPGINDPMNFNRDDTVHLGFFGQNGVVQLLPEVLPNDHPMAQAFLQWFEPYQLANPNLTNNDILIHGLKDFTRIRHSEMQAILRGGSYDPEKPQGQRVELKPVEESRFITFNRNEEGEVTKIYIRSIPPIFSQVMWSLLSDTFGYDLEQQRQFTPNIEEFMLESFQNVSFRLIEYLGEVLSRHPSPKGCYIETRIMIIDLFQEEEDANGQMVSHSWQTVGNYYQQDNAWEQLYAHFHNVVTLLAAQMAEYERFEAAEATSIWFATWSFQYPEPTSDENYLSAFATFPIALSEKYAFRAPLISAGFCVAEVFWWIVYGSLLQEHNSNRNANTRYDEMRKEFLHWMAREARHKPAQFEEWASGSLTILKRRLWEEGLLFQMFEVESLQFHTNVGKMKVALDPETSDKTHLERIRMWVAKFVDPFAPILVYNAHHIFEIQRSHLPHFLFRLLPDLRWKTQPIKPRKFHKKKGKYQQNKETKTAKIILGNDEMLAPPAQDDEIYEAVFDIECFNTASIQVPYLIVFKELWGDQKEFIYRKETDDDDVMERFRFDIWYRYIDQIHENPKGTGRGDRCGNSTSICRHHGHVRNRRIRVWSHNGCRYDLVYFLNSILLESVSLLGDVTNFKMITWANLTFVDFYNFFSTSLDKLAKDWLGQGKLEHPDFALITSATWKEYLPIMEPYCCRDVDILGKIVLKFLDVVHGFEVEDPDAPEGRWKLERPMRAATAASLAVSIWKEMFNTHWIEPCPENIYKWFREEGMFFGGMTAVFKKRPPEDDYPLKIFDINSAYPSVMKEESMPTRFINSSKKFDKPMNLRDFMKTSMYKSRGKNILSYRITEWHAYPETKFWPLAQRVKQDGLYYTRHFYGQTRRWCCDVESLIRYGDIIIDMVDFWESKPIFAPFITFAYTLRQKAKTEGNVVLDAFLKLLMNSVYGKLCQNPFPETIMADVGRVYQILKDRDLLGKVRSIKKVTETLVIVFLEQDENSHPVSDGRFIPIASYITALVRSKLTQAADLIGQNNIIYCDTDSMFISRHGNLPPQMVGNELGQWKLEGTVPKKFVAIASKLYAYVKTAKNGTGELVMRAKGVPLRYLSPELYGIDKEGNDLPQENERKRFTIPKIFQMRQFQMSMIPLEVDKVISFIYNRRRWKNDSESDLYETLAEALEEKNKARMANRKLKINDKKGNLFTAVSAEPQSLSEVQGNPLSVSSDIISTKALKAYPLRRVNDFESFMAECDEIKEWINDYIGLIRLKDGFKNPSQFIKGLFNSVDLPQDWINAALDKFSYIFND